MPKDPLDPDRCARLLSALAGPERLAIVRLLRASGPMTVGDIAAGAGVSLANDSHHLTVPKRSKMLKAERQGRYVRYQLAPKALAPAGEGMLNLGCCRLRLP